jgi:hypothetical protein
MTNNVVWLVFIEGVFVEDYVRKDVYRVFSSRNLAESCVKHIEANKHNKKFDGMWVAEAWISDEYVLHEDATP